MASIAKYTGSLQSIGNTVIEKGAHKYALIEIGGVIVEKVRASPALDGFLRRGLSDQGDVTVWIINGLLVAIELSDGKRYLQLYKPAGPIAMSIISIIALPVFGYGLLIALIYFLGKGHQEYLDYNALKAERDYIGLSW